MADALRCSVALVASLLVGCTSLAPLGPPADATAPPPTPTASAPSAALSRSPVPAARYEEVEFGVDGGPTLRGRVWSEGPIGVVLAHGFSPDSGQDDWDAFAPTHSSFAEYLAGLGYGVLTFDFRGFCDRGGCSEGGLEPGENWRDVVAAVEYLRARGAERIFVVGASMGGINTFRAAYEVELDLAGIVSLSTPQFPSTYYTVEPPENDVAPKRLKRIAAPKLFIAGADDVQLPGTAPLRPGVESVRFADDARAMFEASREPRQLEIIESANHSSELVTSAGQDIVENTRELIVAFIEEHA